MNYVITAVVLFVIYAIYRWLKTTPATVRFIRVQRFQPQPLPEGFINAWECVETTQAKASYKACPSHCPICGMSLHNSYTREYTWKNYRWTGLERLHYMHNHVLTGPEHGYHLPDAAFMQDIMEAAPSLTH